MAGLEQPEHIVKVQDVFPAPGLLEDGQEPILPLADKRHAGNQTGRRQQPDAVLVLERRALLANLAVNIFVNQGALADLARPQQQQWAALSSIQQACQFRQLRIPKFDAIEVVGVLPIETAADAAQLGRALDGSYVAEHQEFFLLRPSLGDREVDNEIEGRDVGRARKRGGRGVDLGIIAFQLAEMARQDLGRAVA